MYRQVSMAKSGIAKVVGREEEVSSQHRHRHQHRHQHQHQHRHQHQHPASHFRAVAPARARDY